MKIEAVLVFQPWLSKDSTSPTKQHLHYQNKGCAFAVTKNIVESYINRLSEASASSWDMPLFCSQVLDFVNHRVHQM